MTNRTFNANEVLRGFAKLEAINAEDPQNGLNLRTGKEKYGWYYVNGERAFAVSKKMGRNTVGKGRLKALITYLRLSKADFAELCDCSLSGPVYHSRMVDRKANGTL